MSVTIIVIASVMYDIMVQSLLKITIPRALTNLHSYINASESIFDSWNLLLCGDRWR